MFSPIAIMTSIKLVISLTDVNHWYLHHVDVKNTFLNDIIKEEVYMVQHPKFVNREYGKLQGCEDRYIV